MKLPSLIWIVSTVAASACKDASAPDALPALALSAQPGAGASGGVLSTQPVVEIRDGHGRLDTASTAIVTASLASGGGTLSGTMTAAAVRGVATFTDLVVTGDSGGRTLRF